MAIEAKGQEKDPNANAQGNEQDAPKTPEASGSKLSDTEAKLLKEVMAYKSELKALKDATEKQEAEKLKEAGKYKELHEKAESKLQAMNDRLIKAELKATAQKEGLTDLDFLALIDKSKVSVDKNGDIVGVDEAIAALKASKPILFQAPTPPGTPKPGNLASGGSFKTHEEWLKAPVADRMAWAQKHPQAYAALVEEAKKQKY